MARLSMGRLTVPAAALLVVAWHFSPRTMAVAQLLAPPPPGEHYDGPPTVGLPLSPPAPPGESDSPELSPMPDSPPPPEPEAPEPTPPPRQPWQAPLPPKREPAPPRTVVPPQEPAWSSAPPPAARAINYTAIGCTTMLVFGDSTVDPGNNNRLQTAVKANFLPYGTNFLGGKPTGRFTNGRLITDILATYLCFCSGKLGIARSIPGLRNPMLRSGQLRRGVSFASAGSGYDDATARRSNALSFPNQIEDLWRYKRGLQRLVGARRAERLVRKATFVISAGTTDLLFHYLASNQSAADSGPRYENQLITRIVNYTQAMATLGGRRFVFVGVPPIGCLPLVRTLLRTGTTRCHESFNLLATSFNKKLVEVVRLLKNEPDFRATFVDVYTTIGMATVDPSNFGLTETSRG
ncbi:hypothetical protein ABZP36_008393 [Zizania latifolia]